MNKKEKLTSVYNMYKHEFKNLSEFLVSMKTEKKSERDYIRLINNFFGTMLAANEWLEDLLNIKKEELQETAK